MADNLTIKDGSGAVAIVATKDIAGVQHNKSIPVDEAGVSIFGSKTDAKATATDATPASAMSIWKQISASVQALVAGITLTDPRVGGFSAIPTANFTRPADTTAYALGDLVANSTTAGSVSPLSFIMSRATGLGGMLRRVRLRKSGTSITSASFRVHFYTATPTLVNGDNGAWSSNQVAAYVGSVDVVLDKVFTDGSSGYGVPSVGNEINFTADTYYAVLEARAAYTPANAEVFTLDLELIRN